MVGIYAFFLFASFLLLFSLFLKGSSRSFLGMRLFVTICLATLFLIFLPKLLKALDNMIEVALANDLNYSCFFLFVLYF